MISKLTYEELEQRVHFLEKELHKRTNSRHFVDIFNKSNLPIFVKDLNFKYIAMNHQLQRLANVVGKKIQGKDDFAIFSEPVARLFRTQDEEILRTQDTIEFEETVSLPDGRKYTFMTSKFPLFDEEGKMYAIGGVCTDITLRKQTEAALKEARESLRTSRDELEHRVTLRTTQLNQKTEELMEINIALEVLLKKRDEDKKELEKTVRFNIEKIIYPYLLKLRSTNSKQKQNILLQAIESNLEQISSSLTQNQTARLTELTPMQIQVANLIKQGLTSKEIASLLNLSPSTISCHRQEIRKRLSLYNKKINLQATLLSFSE